MILVDVYIPAVDESFDFALDENTLIEKVILEIIEMIAKKMKGSTERCAEDFFLYSIDKKEKLEKLSTLYASGVIDGSRLMLV
jgi:hypothetical protein